MSRLPDTWHRSEHVRLRIRVRCIMWLVILTAYCANAICIPPSVSQRCKHILAHSGPRFPHSIRNPFISSANQTDTSGKPEFKPAPATMGPVEVLAETAGSFFNGALFGYVIGGLGAFNPEKGLTTLADRHGAALQLALAWGGMGASFSGFTKGMQLVRGGKNDRWNSVIGSSITGALLSYQQGPTAMLQGAASWGALTYVVEELQQKVVRDKDSPSSAPSTETGVKK